MRWAFQTLNALVDEEVKALPKDMQARFLRFAKLTIRVFSRKSLQLKSPAEF